MNESMMRLPIRRLGVLFLAALALGRPALAQIHTGRIDVVVLDATGGVLPGVTIDLSGPQNQTSVSDLLGEAHFLNLPVGSYYARATLAGFADYQQAGIYVGAGAAIPIRITLQIVGLQAQVEVVAGDVVVEPRKQLIATNISTEELQNVPTARDPWVILQSVPGVIVDRVNVGGSESGQQSYFTAKGADFVENSWNLDGIPITDMVGWGGTPSYYDFDTFQEMQFTTGGADAQVPSPGVHLNLVLKQGSNTPRGTARVFFANDALQSENLPVGLEAVAGRSGKGNRTDQYADYGFEFGGPLKKDRWWGWGALGRTDVRILTLDGAPDRTVLRNVALKATGQLQPATRVSFTYFGGQKDKFGRFAGPFNPPEATVDQDNPSAVYKGEANLILGQSVFLTGRAAYASNEFTLEPKGGRNTQVFLDANNVFHNSFYYLETDRPQKTALVDGNWFRGRHEVKFGASLRHVKEFDASGFAGQVLNIELAPGSNELLAVFYRPWSQLVDASYVGSYIGDTITAGRLTAHLALRYDRTVNSALETPVTAHPLIPDVLPAFTAPAVKNAITWNTLSPRAGAAYALDDGPRTILRGSYAVFASQLGVQEAGTASSASYAYVYYLSVDANRNQATEPSEILRNVGPLGAVGVDLANPTRTTSVNRIDPDLSSPRTHELIVGLDRELFGNVVITTSLVWRRVTNALWGYAVQTGSSPFVGARREDYVQDGIVTGSTPETGAYQVAYYALKPSEVPLGGGIERVNRDGYHRRFIGFEASAVKRLSNRWMARVGFSMNDEREYFDDPAISISDPTPTPTSPLRDGGVVVRDTSPIGKSSFFLILPRYQFVANGVWQGPWGVNVAGSMLSRQGFGMPFFEQVQTRDPLRPVKNVLVVDDINRHRLAPLTTIDVRLEKTIAFPRFNLLVDLDIFNLANVSTELRRQYNVKATGARAFNNVLEIVNPRILRLGVRLTF
ncbi:MAG: carboxypeptidase regulatory-like domain-containing protein [Vicinamibacterales bacterium]